ncbi:MAG TPA: type II 3-dehydroquinate dehydratase [Baekduia sp.]|jgi:3-dehydroquinate dehydratase-2|nr:type II 3-dehydroquinate dehydratase [Baekduia sp.]
MSVVRNRVEVLHGVNLDMLGKRPAEHYGSLTFDQLEQKIEADARSLGLVVRFFQSNHEGEFVEHLHSLDGLADAVILNPGAWTHYSWAIRDALEICGLPAVEVHLSDITAREEFRKHSVVSDLCLQTVKGRGPDGYRDALETLAKELDS